MLLRRSIRPAIWLGRSLSAIQQEVVSMANRKSRIERLEKELKFRRWLDFSRFLEGITHEQLEEIAIHWRFPEPLPEPLPMGASRLDGLDRKTLLKLWETSEHEIARIMREQEGRNEDELEFELDHGHWPEEHCPAGCRQLQGAGSAKAKFP
jgi:hypothetical protein